MGYVDVHTIHTPTTGGVAPAAWGVGLRSNQEFFVDPPLCSVFNSANQLISHATVTALTANSENFDNDAMHSTVSNTSRITIQTAGRYQALARVSFAANGTGEREVRFRVDGTTLINGILLPNSSTSTWRAVLVGWLQLAAGQYIECMVNQDSGSSLNAALVEFAAGFWTR